MKKIVISLGVIGLLFGAAYLSSPYFTLFQITRAAQAGDAQSFMQFVDTARVRENLTQTVSRIVLGKGLTRPDSGNPLATLDQAASAALINPMVENLVTPENKSSLNLEVFCTIK